MGQVWARCSSRLIQPCVSLDRFFTDSLVSSPTTAIVFVHMHKAGGSLLCNLAVLNGEKARSGATNCNQEGDGPSTTPGSSAGKSCEQRERDRVIAGYTFMGVERFMDPELCKTRYMYITVLREPFTRIASHMYYDVTVESNFVRPLATVLSTPPHAFRRAHEGHWCSWNLASANNYYVRTLLGKEVYIAKAGAVTPAHLARANGVLEEFTAVLILEKWDASQLLLTKLFGWRNTAPRQLPWKERLDNRNDHPKFEQLFSSEEQTQLRALNELDVALYDKWSTRFDTRIEAEGLSG